jgi:beta-1,4-galactosyltransferase 1
MSIIVPYRDRADHLRIFIPAIAKALPNVPVLVIEQSDTKPFNRAKLLNIGAKIAFANDAKIIITHDVDMIPTSETKYAQAHAGHLANAASQFGGKMPYDRYFGGVNVFSKEFFQAINGYSNEYWGWGAEDDDMLNRVEQTGVVPFRPDYPNPFMSLQHKHGLEKETHKANCARMTSGYDTSKEGLNTLEYELVGVKEMQGYKLIRVEL